MRKLDLGVRNAPAFAATMLQKSRFSICAADAVVAVVIVVVDIL
jgi:hypothetical protein